MSWLRWQEVAGGVHAEVVDQVVERDELAPSLRHLRPLPALEQVHELHDLDLQPVGVAAERLPRRSQATHVAVVVRPGTSIARSGSRRSLSPW